MNFKNILDEEIKTEIEELGKINLGTEDYKVTVDGLAKLMDKSIELKKLEIESEEKQKDRESELDARIAQIEAENRDRLVKNVLTASSIIIPAALTVWGTVKSFEFEKEGTITTTIGRGFINKLLPKK